MKNMKKLISFFMTLALTLGMLAGTAVPASAESAPSITIRPLVTSSPNEQAFSVTVERESDYEAYVSGSQIAEGNLSAGTTTLSFNQSSAVLLQVYSQYDSDDDGTLDRWNMVQGYSAQSYNLTVTAEGPNGQVLYTDTLLMDYNNYREYVYTPQASIQQGDVIYTPAAAQYLVEYGDTGLTIPYSSNRLENRNITVYYLDENDNQLHSEMITLAYGESYQLTAPASLESNGQTYQLTSAVREYNLTYDNADSTYVFEYAQVIPAPQEPYEITINLVDAENDNAVLYSIRQTMDVDRVVRVELPATYEVNFKQYQLADGVEPYIEREFSSTRSTVYNIPYVVSQESAPYSITINFVDYDNPETILSAMTATVTPDGEPYMYDVSSNSTLEINGVTYQLMAGQGNENGQIVHTYGSTARTYSVYYTAQEVANPQPYSVTLRYISVEDNAVLETQQLEVAYGSSISFDAAPATVTVDGTEYTRLNGQEEAITHGYNESQTSYAVYYMATASLAEVEVEPEVITQVVTQYVTADGTIVENADGTSVPVTVPVTTVTGGDGDETNYNEEGQEVTIEEGTITVIPDEEVPLTPTVPESSAAETEAETETAAESEGVDIEDEEVPLASAVPEQGGNGPSAGAIIGICAGIAVVAAIIAAVVIKRKKSGENA